MKYALHNQQAVRARSSASISAANLANNELKQKKPPEGGFFHLNGGAWAARTLDHLIKSGDLSLLI